MFRVICHLPSLHLTIVRPVNCANIHFGLLSFGPLFCPFLFMLLSCCLSTSPVPVPFALSIPTMLFYLGPPSPCSSSELHTFEVTAPNLSAVSLFPQRDSFISGRECQNCLSASLIPRFIASTNFLLCLSDLLHEICRHLPLVSVSRLQRRTKPPVQRGCLCKDMLLALCQLYLTEASGPPPVPFRDSATNIVV